MTDKTQAEALQREYRATMPADVLHLWAKDAIACLAELEAQLSAIGAGGVEALRKPSRENFDAFMKAAEDAGVTHMQQWGEVSGYQCADCKTPLRQGYDCGACGACGSFEAEEVEDPALQAAPPAPAAVAVPDETTPEYGSTDLGWSTFPPLADGEKRLMALITNLFGNDHQAFNDLDALVNRARLAPATPAQEDAAQLAGQGLGREFRKKPVVIQAMQWLGDNLRDVIAFTDGPPDTRSHHAGMKWEEYQDLVARDGLKIFTLEGKMNAAVGDWIIRGVKGELYPCKPDIFEATYEDAAAPAQAHKDEQA